MNDISKIDKELMFSPENLTKETIKRYLCHNATDQELMMGLQIAKTFNLNPLKREIYFVKYGDNPMSVLTGYEVYLKRADRSDKYAGMKSWTTGSVENCDLVGHVEIYRKDWTHPLVHEVDYREYLQTKKDGTPNRFWKEKPKTMIKKVAISQGFRLAFPDEFDGMPYTTDEVVDQERIVDIKSVPEELPPKVAMPKSKSESGPLGTVTKEQGIKLINTALDNGWSAEDVKGYIGGLGYKNHKDLNTLDYKTCMDYFSAPKELRMKEAEVEG